MVSWENSDPESRVLTISTARFSTEARPCPVPSMGAVRPWRAISKAARSNLETMVTECFMAARLVMTREQTRSVVVENECLMDEGEE
jgi:hypothetical protein